MAPPVRPRFRAERRAVPEAELVLAGRAWVGGRLQPLEIGFDGDGWICAVGRAVPGARRHDVGDRVLLPAATDMHVHLREPGPSESGETIATGTVGAALGGVGLVGEMPNTEPPTSTVDRLDEKEGRVRGRAAVDVLLYAAPADVRSLRSLGRRAGGFKLYLSPTTGIDTVPTGPELASLLDGLSAVDLPVAVHAEEPARFRPASTAVDPATWDDARPAAAEAAAVARVLGAPERLRLHVAHVTTAAIARGIGERGLSFEATAHHLLLSSSAGGDARWKVNPPLRTERERAALWAEFRAGRVPVLASDHAPHSPASKALPFDRAPSGVPGVETTLPLLLARVAAGELPLPVLLQSACDRPARLLGQPVGRLSVGHRANVLVVDFRSRSRVRGDRLRSPCGWSPFEGAPVVFPAEHWRGGERIVDSGEYIGRPTGAVVRPEYAPGAVRGNPGPE
ncbi:MAG TPA: amidohydrolase family protein [Thermoplasmata archaeon]|nr:amidohydrolase family protein [Thermoplasmata archaeon]